MKEYRYRDYVIQVIDNDITIYNTLIKGNPINYQLSKEDDFNRRDLFSAKNILINISSDEKIVLETVDRLNLKVGKFITYSQIPKLIESGNYKIKVPLNSTKETLNKYIKMGLDLNPDFQRGYVWTLEQKIKFVEFLIKEGKCNPIYFNAKYWQQFKNVESFVVVDGKQRLQAVCDFIDEKFRVFKELDEEKDGYLYSDFVFFPMTSGFEFCINDLKNRKEVLQWYIDLNTGGTIHTEDEISKVMELIKECDKNEQ